MKRLSLFHISSSGLVDRSARHGTLSLSNHGICRSESLLFPRPRNTLTTSPSRPSSNAHHRALDHPSAVPRRRANLSYHSPSRFIRLQHRGSLLAGGRLPLGSIPRPPRPLSFNGRTVVPASLATPTYLGRYLLSRARPGHSDPHERCTNLFSSFSTSLRILSVDSKHSQLFEMPSIRIPLTYLRALDLAPSQGAGHTFSLALPLTPAATLTALRLPAVPSVFDALRVKILAKLAASSIASRPSPSLPSALPTTSPFTPRPNAGLSLPSGRRRGLK